MAPVSMKMGTQKTLFTIIEKFAPSSLKESVQQIKALSLNDPPNLNYLSNLILQKVDMEADMAKEYAKLCACLQEMDVFKVVLIDNCKTKFAKAIVKHTQMKSRRQKFFMSVTPRVVLNDEPSDEEENTLRCSTMGLCSFIGELFRLKVLASKAVCGCIHVLLTLSDDFSLDCLCTLLGTCGKQLEESLRKKGSEAMEFYFSSINSIMMYHWKFNISDEVMFKAVHLAILRKITWNIRVDVEKQTRKNQEEANKEKKIHKIEEKSRLKKGEILDVIDDVVEDLVEKKDFGFLRLCQDFTGCIKSALNYLKRAISFCCMLDHGDASSIIKSHGHQALEHSEEIPLRHRAKDALKPTVFSQEDTKNMNSEEKISEALYAEVRGILNELGPEKFPMLIRKFKALEIDTAPRLREVIKLIFEMAINEPKDCKWHVRLCEEMQHLTVPQENSKFPISFRTLLLNQCQAQFESNTVDEEVSVYTKSVIDACSNPEMKKEIQLLFEEHIMRKSRRKSVGTCRFIGELFKYKMLSSEIIMHCLRQLFTRIREEKSLECLCVLLITTSSDLTQTVGIQECEELDQFFKEIQDIAENKTYHASPQMQCILWYAIQSRRHHLVPHTPFEELSVKRAPDNWDSYSSGALLTDNSSFVIHENRMLKSRRQCSVIFSRIVCILLLLPLLSLLLLYYI